MAKTWPVLAVAFATLVMLTGLFAGATGRRVEQLRRSLLDLSASYEAEHDQLDHLRTNLYVSSLLLRDYLMRSETEALSYKKRILLNKEFSLKNLNGLQSSSQAGRTQLQSLQSELTAFWSSIEPVFTWTREQKRTFGYTFLQENVVPRREAVIALAEELADLSASRLKAERGQVNETLREFDVYLNRLTFLTLLLTACVAIASLRRISQLEARSRSEHERTQEAEHAMRRLSQQLVKAHEEERRVLSRELHDELGQRLTSLKVSLRNAQGDHNRSQAASDGILEDCQSLLEQSIQSVRDLAMGLRPSMLDDLGLGPAIEWQAREFSRRYDTPVTVDIQEGFDRGLTDNGRTSIYRIVQETLTNCARHAKASRVDIHMKRANGMSVLVVEDDGAGIRNRARTGNTVGLLGIEERVRELGGTFSIGTRETGGTAVVVKVPAAENSSNG